MKTRIIQDDPGGRPRHERSADPAESATRPNLAARMARWSAHHRKKAIFGWLALAIALFAVSIVSPAKQIVTETSGPGESGRADTILYDDFKQPAGESVLIQSKTLTADSPKFQAGVQAVITRLSKLGEVAKVESPFDKENDGLISDDKHSALVGVEIRGPSDDAADKVDSIVAGVAQTQKAYPGLTIGSFGESTNKAVQAAFFDDLKKAGLYSVPLTLIILLVAFGALVAAGIPLLLGVTAVLATLGLVAIVSNLLPMSDSVSAIVLLIGLAVGVDYTMFYLKREREERAAGHSEEAALEIAAATSGRSVLVSGCTVIVAMAGMFFTGDADFASFGVATMTVVAVAMLGSLTVLPALLSKLGDNVDRVRVPFVHRLRRDDGEGRIWGAIIDRVLRRPVLSVALAGGLLVAIALPAVQLRTAQPSIDTFPQNLLTTYNRLKEAFPGTDVAASVVVKAPNVEAPEVVEAIGQLEALALDSGVMNHPIDVDVNDAKTVANISIPFAGDGTDSTSIKALSILRDDIVPRYLTPLAGAEVGVTGATAQQKDFSSQMKSVAPLVFGFVLLFAFLVMLVSFRSLVIAAKTIVLNLLSVGAAYGILVMVFQHGWGKGLLGFEFTGGIDPFLPILLFVILFGLSMDYHVFVLSRIRESVDRGLSTDEAIAHGIKSTAGVVTSAAIVMVAVFAIFGTLQMMIFKQFGVGLAAAILIDATIIRAILLPATMKLLGDWNWYLPSWLEWLPHFEHGGSVAEPKVEAPSLPVTTA
ncbi:MAG TPA: MMPL family transporter [Gaiellaceae bacterium]|nr:MMPL family transporter [Gaiellaceae bacterium]